MATGQEVKNFIESIAPLVINICNKKSRKILPSVCIAQACIESAYGTTERMVRANALFGIKVGSGLNMVLHGMVCGMIQKQKKYIMVLR